MHAKKTAFVVEHDFIMATYLADRFVLNSHSIKFYYLPLLVFLRLTVYAIHCSAVQSNMIYTWSEPTTYCNMFITSQPVYITLQCNSIQYSTYNVKKSHLYLLIVIGLLLHLLAPQGDSVRWTARRRVICTYTTGILNVLTSIRNTK